MQVCSLHILLSSVLTGLRRMENCVVPESRTRQRQVRFFHCCQNQHRENRYSANFPTKNILKTYIGLTGGSDLQAQSTTVSSRRNMHRFLFYQCSWFYETWLESCVVRNHASISWFTNSLLTVLTWRRCERHTRAVVVGPFNLLKPSGLFTFHQV